MSQKIPDPPFETPHAPLSSVEWDELLEKACGVAYSQGALSVLKIVRTMMVNQWDTVREFTPEGLDLMFEGIVKLITQDNEELSAEDRALRDLADPVNLAGQPSKQP